MVRRQDRFNVAFSVSAELLALPARGNLKIWRTRLPDEDLVVELSLRADRNGAKFGELRLWQQGEKRGHLLATPPLAPDGDLSLGGAWYRHADGGTLELRVNSRVVTRRTGVLDGVVEPVVTGADLLALLLEG